MIYSNILIGEVEFKKLAHDFQMCFLDQKLDYVNIQAEFDKRMPEYISFDHSFNQIVPEELKFIPQLLLMKHACRTYGIDVSLIWVYRVSWDYTLSQMSGKDYNAMEMSYTDIVYRISRFFSKDQLKSLTKVAIAYDFKLFLMLKFDKESLTVRKGIDKSVTGYVLDLISQTDDVLQNNQLVAFRYDCKHSRRALRCYAMSIKDEQPKVSISIIEKIQIYEAAHIK